MIAYLLYNPGGRSRTDMSRTAAFGAAAFAFRHTRSLHSTTHMHFAGTNTHEQPVPRIVEIVILPLVTNILPIRGSLRHKTWSLEIRLVVSVIQCFTSKFYRSGTFCHFRPLLSQMFPFGKIQCPRQDLNLYGLSATTS